MTADLGAVATADPTGARPAQPAARRVRAAAGVLATVVVAFGLGLRIWIIGRAPMNSDMAVVGLMAREILHGHLFAFYWGQNYGGVEPYVTAGLFGIFGQSSFALSMTGVILDAAAAVLVWRVGLRLFDPAEAAGAALLFWVWPEVYLWQSTIEYGFRWAALVLGLALLLVTLRLCDGAGLARPRRVVLGDWVALGAAFGLGWWATPEIAYYAIPSALLLAHAVVRRGLRPRPRQAAAALLAAVLGALPWIWSNLAHGFSSLVNPSGLGSGGGSSHRLQHLIEVRLPRLIGLRRSSGAWAVTPALGKALVALVLVVVAAALVAVAVLLVRRFGQRALLALGCCCLFAPLLYSGFYSHLRIFVVYTLPIVVGLRLRGTGAWLFVPWLAKALYVLAVIGAAAFLAGCALKRRAAALVLLCLLAPLVYATWPATWYWQDGRYAIFLAPMASLVAAGGAAALRHLRLPGAPVPPPTASPRFALRSLAGPAVAVAAGVALTLGAAGSLSPYRPSTASGAGWLSWRSDANSYLDPVVTGLERAGVSGVYAGYWLAYDLAFEARSALAVSDVTFVRYLPYLERVSLSEHTAWLFPSAAAGPRLGAEGLPVGVLAPGCSGGSACLTIPELEAYLLATNDPYRVLQVGGFVAVLPDHPAIAQLVLANAGISGAPPLG